MEINKYAQKGESKKIFSFLHKKYPEEKGK